ncbi:GNAT family N-acetyltransferase [Roseibacterium sp. SDUM158016]|uniref:GNAT family N-acetyltransferase n=1 Tax=Roseicyclus sediminis TaxID=2980997 RepID=UPI0021CF0A23|nr:GNAT family N-acetyltransferase [Roseibacterium sp. SDUM158016]MCU4652730.1 GNAT family N-acetyltransferase [Roseibacterium sp. SDUM158016]
MTALHDQPAGRVSPSAGTVSAYRVTCVTEVTDRAALDDLLLEYYGVILKKLAFAGVPHSYTAHDLKASFWPNLHRFLPPTGRLVLVHDAADRLVGCGTLHQVRPDAGELKRLYVRPEAKGHRLGRAIVDARIEAARDMGWRTLLVNAIRGNTDMTRIYESIGFRYVPRYPECSDPIEVDPWFVYMQYELG